MSPGAESVVYFLYTYITYRLKQSNNRWHNQCEKCFKTVLSPRSVQAPRRVPVYDLEDWEPTSPEADAHGADHSADRFSADRFSEPGPRPPTTTAERDGRREGCTEGIPSIERF